MSTRSRIGIIRERPAERAPIVESIYCHFDGYPEGVGKTLLEHWTSKRKIEQLLKLGDLSALGSVIGEKHDFDSHTGTFVDGAYVEGEASKAGWCLFFGRDRGEEDSSSVTHSLDEWPDYGQECEYVFDPAENLWRVRSSALNPVGWNTVAKWEGWVTIPEAIEEEHQKEAAHTASQR